VERLSTNLGVTDRHLARYFQTHFEQTPKAWLDHLRMADGRRHLRRGLMIKQVAERLGFRHVQDFTRAFERVNSMAPSECRNVGPINGAS
jgi:AraC-like DNA-binding protein